MAVIGAIAVGQVRDVAGAAHRQALGNPRPRHRGLPTQARGQLGFGISGGVHPVLDEPFGQVFIGFVALSRLKGSVLTIDNGSVVVIGAIAVGQVRDVAGAAHRQSLGNPRPRYRRLPTQARPGWPSPRHLWHARPVGLRSSRWCSSSPGRAVRPGVHRFRCALAPVRAPGRGTESFGEALGEIRRASNAHL